MDIGHLLVPVFRALVCRSARPEGTWALALSSALASAMPAGASAPWAAAGIRLAGGCGALSVWDGRGRAPPGAGASREPVGITGPWGLYPFGYRVYPSEIS